MPQALEETKLMQLYHSEGGGGVQSNRNQTLCSCLTRSAQSYVPKSAFKIDMSKMSSVNHFSIILHMIFQKSIIKSIKLYFGQRLSIFAQQKFYISSENKKVFASEKNTNLTSIVNIRFIMKLFSDKFPNVQN